MLPEDPVEAHNRQAWNRLVDHKSCFTTAAEDASFVDPLGTVDGLGWLGGSIAGQRVLCLAAGGGRHGPLYAAAGGEVTVLDISDAMLELDREVATQRRISLRVVQGTMSDLSMFRQHEFDLVIQPVSTCYVRDIARVYRQIARVLRPGGLYVSQHKQPASLQTSLSWNPTAVGDHVGACGGYVMQHDYYSGRSVAPVPQRTHLREPGAQEFVHRWEQLIGDLCRSGFVIEDLVEPFHADLDAEPGSLAHRSAYIAPYVRIKARRNGELKSSLVLAGF
ncbi:MAG: class I SAM-dependent methyltransferase [Planctomycetaceae bacterium]|nr:class I SAM-dependent methyltransferase [Planctomycetaceae bacterium]